MIILQRLITEVGFTVPQLKPRFYLFQRVWDQLYLTPPSMEEHTSSSSAYLGALGFTKPLERIVLRGIPLKSVLECLLKPRGPNLVEATMGAVPEKALVLAVTKRMLYEEDPPSVGVGLVYKPHYISTESFCIAYMHLNMWYAAASDEDSTDKLDSTRLILVSISEMSEVVPVAMLPPVFLDMASKEVVEKTGEPLAPLWFWGFRLHTVWSQPPGKEPVHQIAFPQLQGDITAPMLEYEPEKFPQSMRQGPKIVIPLRPPSSGHWSLTSHSPWQWIHTNGSSRPRGLAEIQNGSLRGLRHLLGRRLFTKGLPWPQPVAARLCPHQRPHAREKRIWRLHWVPSSAFMPSASR